MDRRNKVFSNIAIGAIVIIITLVLFFVGFEKVEKTNLDYLALMFILVSETALFGGLILLIINEAPMSGIIIRSGIISTLSIYWLLTIITYLIYKNAYKDSLGGFVAVQLILLALAAIISISLFMAASNVHASNTKIESSRVLLQDSENMVFNLKNQKAYALHKDSLDRLYETIKYSDKVASDSSIDERIKEHIVNLSNNLREKHEDKEAINECIENIITLVKERNMAVHTAKRGGL
ncbi:hypothetical protein SAMN05444401_1023 [Clostridium amylolyticum]|uniref:Uncharacterized protein n=1 Tax=Clostridium amylolyticum TaxID=1121298 RepID=A0A1M6C737_9CLOT|nr:hypothetical protein [Clostridium amylolyticum]SHI56753.1 hypothetical protein SAMN05444401_1023 [Clostridium amylolyticum]